MAYEPDNVPILVVGCHRSGTSLMRRMLNSHSRIACPAETEFLEGFGAVLGRDSSERALAAIDLRLEDVTGPLADLAQTWMRRYAEQQGKARWADKSPNMTWELEGIDRLFSQQPLYICMIRDGMDVATSLGTSTPPWPRLERWDRRYPHSRTQAAAHYWADINAPLIEFMKQVPERCIPVKYDQLVADPEATMTRVFHALNEPFEPAVLDFNAFSHTGGLEDSIIRTTTTIQDNSGKHRRLPIEEQRAMWSIVQQTMLAHGYEDRTY